MENHHLHRKLLRSVVIALILCSFTGFGGTKPGFDFSATGRLSKTSVIWAKQALQGYNFRMWISNQMTSGIEAWDGAVPPGDCGETGIGCEFPVGACNEHLFGAGPWIAALVDGVRAATEGYNGNNANKYFLPNRGDTLRDRIWQTARDSSHHPSLRSFDDDNDGRIDEDDLDGLDNDGDWVRSRDDLGADGLPDSLETGCKGPYNASTNLDPAFDNFDPARFDSCSVDSRGNFIRKGHRDLYTQNNGKTDHGEPNVDEDYAAISDNDLYAAATDTFREPTYPLHRPLGIKVFQKSYAWRGTFADGILPIEYYFVNVGKKTLEDVYVGFFADMDVGPINIPNYFVSNYAAYFDEQRTAYIHNPLHRGATPLGLTALAAPRKLSDLQYVFQWHDFNEPGTDDSLIYSWMSCERFGGENCVKPDQSVSDLFDTRFFFAFGPFPEMKPGDSLKIAVAFVSGFCADGCQGSLRERARKAIQLWNSGLREPPTVPSPTLTLKEGFKKVELSWTGQAAIDTVWDDSNKVAEAFPADHWRRINPPSGHARGGRIFEGYRLYRSEDPNGSVASFTLLKQFDMNETLVVCDPDSLGGKCDTLTFEYNTGIESTFVDTNLVRGKTYWYAVTSFGLPGIEVTEIADSNLLGGFRYDTSYTPGLESSVFTNRKRVDLSFSVSEKANEVLVVPNPYRVDQDYTFENGGWEGRGRDWTENSRLIKFIHLPTKCTIRVFTMAGDLVTTLEHEDPVRGELEWDILSESNRALASGVYVFTVESDFGRQIGKFVLIR